MNGHPCPTPPNEGQAKDLLYKLLLQTAPKLLEHADLVAEIRGAIKNSVNRMVLQKKTLRQMKAILGAEDFDDLFLLLEGIIEVMKKEQIHTLGTLQDWVNINKEIVSTKEEEGNMPSSITSP